MTSLASREDEIPFDDVPGRLEWPIGVEQSWHYA
jgi:hypothetical protein